MTPQMAIQITGKYAAKPMFDQAVADANRASGAISASGGRVSASMGEAGFATANLAAQFNDIGVMLASGQSPLLLAIQQGTQISQVLGPMKAGAAVAALKTALMSLISPVTLITIGSIAAGAALVQWLMSAKGEAESATEAFERHRKEIANIVAGYGAAETAVGAYFDAISRLPRTVVTNQLNDAFAQIGSDVDDFRTKMAEVAGDPLFAKFGSEAILQMQSLAAAFADGEISAVEFYFGVEDVKGELNLLERAGAAIPGSTAAMIDAWQQGALKAIQFGNAINNLVAQSHALAGVAADDSLASFFEKNSVEGALSALKSLTPELRTQKQIVEDTYATALTNPALTGAGRDQLAAARDAALAAIDEAAARKEAAAAAGKQADSYQRVVDTLAYETQILGLSSRELEVANNLRAAGVDAASEQGQAIQAATEALYDQREALEAFHKEQEKANRELERLGQIGVNAIDSVAAAFEDGTVSGQEMMQMVRALGKQLSQLDWGSIGNFLFGGGGTSVSSLITGSSGGYFPGLTGPSLPSFDGGGSTGSGVRAGGLDGKGGFAAILHPQERVIDETLAPASGGAHSIEVHVHQDAGHEGPPEASVSSRGNVDVVRIIVGTVGQALSDGTLDNVMRANFGLGRKPAL